MAFSDEKDFERALIAVLFDKGWSREVIKYPTENAGSRFRSRSMTALRGHERGEARVGSRLDGMK